VTGVFAGRRLSKARTALGHVTSDWGAWVLTALRAARCSSWAWPEIRTRASASLLLSSQA
jgi:hypothetical protein